MEWGSSYIYDYSGESEDEELSVGELEEGMYLSDSDGEDDTPSIPPPPLHVIKRSGTAKPPKLSIPDDGSSSEDEDDNDELTEGQLSRQSGYVDLSFSDTPPAATAGGGNNDGKNEEQELSGKYVQLKQLQDEIRGQQTGKPLPAPNKTQSTTVPTVPSEVTPQPKAQSCSVPVPPPPPIKQLHGIMKGEQLQKLKKQRVHWNKSYRKRDNSQGIKTRRADTNVLAVKFNTLSETGNIHTGDAQFCSHTECGAVVSHLTKLIGDENDDKKIWNCEFCGTATELDIVSEEIPTVEDTTYLITPAAVMAATEGGTPVGGIDESLVVFCIDTSGSMCVTTEVPGHYELRSAKEKRDKAMKNLPAEIAAEMQLPEYRFVQGRQRNVTWISRMESLQAAVDTQLSRLVHSEPNKRVSIVTFSDDVSVIGDGRMVPVTIAGVKLSDSKSVIDAGKDIPLPAPIRETQKALSKKIFSLEENGQTALGPAALTSVVIASQKPGSRVVLCTDGLANIGLGSLDVAASDRAAYANAENFYEDLGDIAMDKGVTVSLLSIKGSDCRVVELGQIATRTGGQVTIVDPLTVTEEFGSILSNPILATDVVTKIIVHKEMYFRDESSKENVIVKQVGNVTADSELTFEYGVRKIVATDKPVKKVSAEPKRADDDSEEEVKSKSQATPSGASSVADKPPVPPLTVNGQPHLGFQLQIEYTNSDGDRCLRVITQTKPVTKDRLVAEKAMDAAVISSHVGKKAAELTMQGEFTQARVSSLATQRLLQEHSRSSATKRKHYRRYCDNLLPLENQLHTLQMTETSHGLNYSDDEGEQYLEESDLMCTSYARPKMTISSIGAPVKASSSSKSGKVSSRRQEMSDDMSFGVIKLYNSSSTSYR